MTHSFSPRFRWSAALFLAAIGFPGAAPATPDPTPWPAQYKVAPWETNRLTAADVVGPDGIVYPDWTGAGVTGGIPDLDRPEVRADYVVFDVTQFRANAKDDDEAAAAALTAALAHASAATTNRALLYFPAGTYQLSSPLRITSSRVVVKGDGMDRTTLALSPRIGAKGGLLDFKPAPPKWLADLPSNGTIFRGNSTVVFERDAAAAGFAVGDWVRIVATKCGPGTTMSDRFSQPERHVVYTDALYQFGRLFLAKIIAIDSATGSVTFDRTFPHDVYANEVPTMRRISMLESIGVQDLTIETVSGAVELCPISWTSCANAWMKNVHILKPANHPFDLQGVARCEIRSCNFEGTHADINRGSTAYLGWLSGADNLMEKCTATDLRHMSILQMASRCVIRDCTFTGRTITSPQLHGRFPLENLIEGTTFDCTGLGETARGITAFATDAACTLRHGPNGPRNVFYNNNVLRGAGSFRLLGCQENFIVAYNRICLTDQTEALPTLHGVDRTFDVIVRGNAFQSIAHLPLIVLEDPTCPGWDVRDNDIYGDNGWLSSGDSRPVVDFGNRFHPNSPPPETPRTETPSIFAWQREHAAAPRLLIVRNPSADVRASGALGFQLVRVKSSNEAPLSVTLTCNPPGLTVPQTVTIAAGDVAVPFIVTPSRRLKLPERATLTAAAPDLLPDAESVRLGTNALAGKGHFVPNTNGIPTPWQSADLGRVLSPGSSHYDKTKDVWTLTGTGVEAATTHSSLARSGRHFLFQPVEGDGEIIARINASAVGSRAGLMIADDTGPLTDFFRIDSSGRVLHSSNGDGSLGAITQATASTTNSPPVWLRLTRRGPVFQAAMCRAAKPDKDSDWTSVATVNFYQDAPQGGNYDYKSPATLDSRMYFGLFFEGNSPAAAAKVEGVRVTCPAPAPR